MQLTKVKVDKKIERLRMSLLTAIDNHKDCDKEEILACAAFLVGQLIALQDQSLLTAQQAITLVMKNIEQGNYEAMQTLLNTQGNA